MTLTSESLKKSREIRADFLKRFKLLPSSILRHDRIESKNRTLDIVRTERGGGYSNHYKKMKTQIMRRDDYTPGLENTGMKMQGRENYLSGFPQNVGRFIVELYCPEKGVIYDSFAGHNSRMELCFRCNRDYIGVDVSKNYMECNRIIADKLISHRNNSLNPLGHNSTITLIEGSSTKVDLPDESADFSITSPPYWDIEYYGDEAEQLGTSKTYEEFINRIALHVRENFRILKKGSYCFWFVNDFRKKGVFYPYHSDLMYVFEQEGFTPFNVYIVDLGVSPNQAFIQEVLKHKLLPKQHEYCLGFIKE